MKRALFVTGLLTLLVCSAYGQTRVTANIPFDFVAAGTTLPAGTYEFTPINNLDDLQVRNTTTRKTIIVPIVTRLGTGENNVANVTFDKMGDKRFLETVMPPLEDGYLLHVTKEKHTHNVVKAG